VFYSSLFYKLNCWFFA